MSVKLMNPSLAAQEARRLAALRSCHILDTAPEAAFDRIVRMAAALFGVPTALLNFIDEDRQWCKASQGINYFTQSPREDSLCTHAIRQPDVLVIEDAEQDPRFDQVKFRLDHGVRFYAGAPLILESGDAIGSLCVVDTVPRSFSEAEVAQLRDLAAMVIDLLEARRDRVELERMEAQLRMAEDVIGFGTFEINLRTQTFHASPWLANQAHADESHNGAALDFHIDHYVHPEDRGKMRRLCAESAARPGHYEGDYRIPDGDQMLHRHLAVISPEASDDPVLFGIIQDTTAQRIREEALREQVNLTTTLKSILDSLGDAVLAVDQDGDVLYCSRSLEWLTAYPASEWVERCGLHQLDGETPYQADEWPLARALSGEVVLGDLVIRKRPDRPERAWSYVSAAPIRDADGRMQGAILLMRDVTEEKEAEVALVATQERFLRLFNGVSHGVVLADGQGRMMEVNPAFTRMLGYENDELASLDHIDLTHPEDRALEERAVTALFDGKSQGYSIEKRMRRRGGTYLWVRTTVSVNRDARGVITDGFTLLEDITDQRRAEQKLRESEERYRKLVQNASDIILILDARGRSWIQSESAARILRRDLGSLVGQDVFPYIHEEDVERTRNVFAQLALDPGGQARAEFRFMRGDGTWVDMEAVAVNWLHDPVIEGIIVTLRDITDRKNAERTLREALERERELGELKSRFVAMASHEFRTPLAVIYSSSELIAQFLEKGRLDRVRHYLGRIQTNVDDMNALLEDVLTVGRADAGRLVFEPQPTDIAEFVRDAIEEFQIGPGADHHVHLTAQSMDARAEVDIRLLRQIIGNLLSNAAKYSDPGSRVDLALSGDAETICLSVRDQGIGIPAHELPRLFESFHRADNVGTRRGTGLGLVILKRAVDLHGGRIDIDSEEGHGTTVCVCLPRMQRIAVQHS